MKILSKLDNTGMIEEVADKRYVTDAEKLRWNSKSVVDLGTFNDEEELTTHVATNQLPTGYYTFVMDTYPCLMLLREVEEEESYYSGWFHNDEGSNVYIVFTKTGEIIDIWFADWATLDNLDFYMPRSNGILESYSENIINLGSSIDPTIDPSSGNVFTHTTLGHTTYSISNPIRPTAHSFTLVITQHTTARTITFPASVKWQGGDIPDMSTASKTYVLTFITVDGGTNWLGMFGGEF